MEEKCTLKKEDAKRLKEIIDSITEKEEPKKEEPQAEESEGD